MFSKEMDTLMLTNVIFLLYKKKHLMKKNSITSGCPNCLNVDVGSA